MRAFHLIVLSVVVATAAIAADPSAKLDTSRGDKMIAEYFKAETAKLAENCLAEIKTLDDWKAKKDLYRQQLFEMLGLSPLPAKTDLKAKTTSIVEHEEFTVENVHFQSSPGLYVTGNLYIPKAKKVGIANSAHPTPSKADAAPKPDAAPAAGKPAAGYPAILYVCGHGGVKKNGVSYGNKTYYTHHGSWFARHGYVCLTIDSLQLGEIEGIHHGTYRYGMWWWLNRGYTPAGVEAWNCIRALDYLETRKEVDKEKFGVTGRSGGGAYSWWIAAIDDRIKVAVPGAGITDMTNHVVDGVVEGHCDCMYMNNTYRWDYAQVAALVAPRPLLISNTDKDTIFPLDGVNRLHEQVRDIYKLHGAEKNLGLNIVEGPHKDSQELQLGAFIWFDRFLKKEERVIEKAAVKIFEPEKLQVFKDGLPKEEANTKIQEHFVAPAAKAEPPKDSALFKGQQEAWMKALREQVFRGWPTNDEAGPLDAREAFTAERDGLRLTAYDFSSQPTIRLRMFVLYRAGLKKPKSVELTALDTHGWFEWRQAAQGAFAADLKEDALEGFHQGMYDALKQRLASEDVALVAVCPRGVGPTAWDQSEKKQTQHRRRFMLLGQTLDGMQVWDIRRAIQAVRDIDALKSSALHLRGARAMGGNAMYASLFEEGIKSVELQYLKPTHREGPIFLNVSKHLDIPQAAAMAATRAPLKLSMAIAGDWSYLTDTAKALGWKDEQFQLTISPPPVGPPPPPPPKRSGAK